MSSSPPPATLARDPLGLGLLLAGIAVALVAAFSFPALHFRGADKSLLGISTWEAVPILTTAKLAFLALALAAALMPSMARLRLPLILAAAVMMFLPAFGALAAAVYQWSDVRAEIVQISGVRAPWIDPGWGVIALLVASMMLIGALWRAHRVAATA
jgi:hypothetical protein